MTRFKTLKNGYKFDKRIFRVCLLVILIATTGMVLRYGLQDNVYYYCPSDAREGFCRNPFITEYGACTIEDTYICNIETFPPGFEYGVKPDWFISNITLLFVVILLTGFVINHYENNKRWAR